MGRRFVRLRGAFRGFQVEVGALQRQLAVRRLDQHIGEDRDGVAAFDDAMDVSESLEQDRTLDGDFIAGIPACLRVHARLDLRRRLPPWGRGHCQAVSANARAEGSGANGRDWGPRRRGSGLSREFIGVCARSGICDGGPPPTTFFSPR